MGEVKIYDISQELFGCAVFPGDPKPQRQVISSMDDGDLYNLTAFSMCAHNGTHVDAPNHFINNGKTVDKMPLSSTVGYTYVAECNGLLSKDAAMRILKEAKEFSCDAWRRILLKGDVIVSEEAADAFAKAEILLLGNESQTVGPPDAPMQVHLTLLSSEVTLLEGIRLDGVPCGIYWLCAAPLLLDGADGAPCRALLIKFE